MLMDVAPEQEPTPSAMRWLVLGIVLTTAIAIHLLIIEHDLIADEGAHGSQLQSFGLGKWALVEGLTTIPGYHLVLAVLCLATGVETANGARLVSLAMSLPAILVFYRMARRFHPSQAEAATLQLYFLPILLPYLFLLYTDGFSLFLVLLSIHLVLCERRGAGAFVGILAMLVRQNNVIWLLFGALLSYLQDFGPTLSAAALRDFVRRNKLFLAGLAGFAAFVVTIGGVALGDQQAHPMRPSLGNVYLLLFLYLVFSLPAQLPAVLAALRWCVADKRVLALGVLVFGIGYATFSNSHPYNQVNSEIVAYLQNEASDITGEMSFARNLLLQEVDRNPAARVVFFAVITLSLLTLLRTRWAIRRMWWVLPVAVIYLVPSWLIEQRYTLIPLALLLLGRERSSPTLEWSTVAWNMTLCGIVLWGIHNELFFL